MIFLFCVLFLLFAGGLASLLLGRAPVACRVAAGAGVVACVLGLGFAGAVLCQGITLAARVPVPLPLGRVLLQVDPLACVFLLPVFLVGGIGCLLMPGRMEAMEGSPHCGRHGFFFCLLMLGTVLAITAADGIFFLLAWEVMSLAPFFLLSTRDANSKERAACWLYLIMAHLGALPLLLLFGMMTVKAGGSSFFLYSSTVHWQGAELLFALALMGFGAKLGLFPLHVWMPESYPVAPGHVAAVLSGAMVNVGLYGLIRVLSMLGLPDIWWAYGLMAAGGISGFMGVVFAIAQPDSKRSLAYSSSENMGITCLALGAGLLAGLQHAPQAMALLFGGALLHMWNHSLFKSLLFVGAGAVEDSTGTAFLTRMGGLQKRMPITGVCMALGCAAIAGLPLLNGFTGELLMYMGFALGGEAMRGSENTLIFWGGLFTLASITGLAVLCFTRLYGMSFLGAPRTPAAAQAQEAPQLTRFIMGGLAALCVAACLTAPWLLRLLTPVLYSFTHRLQLPALAEKHIAFAASTVGYVAMASLSVLTIIGLTAIFRHRLCTRNTSSTGLTWDCGYRLPSARMQYSSGSFALSSADIARHFLRARIETPQLDKSGPIFPSNAPAVSAVLDSPDWPLLLWSKIFAQGVSRLADRAKVLQHGLLNAYILYMLVALLAALVWALGWS